MRTRHVVFMLWLLYLIPSFVQFEYSAEQKIKSVFFGLPMMQTGDEPHYYITLYSLVNDGDFFLSNNYNAAARGCPDLGRKMWTIYDRHTRLFDSVNRSVSKIPIIDDRVILALLPDGKSFVKEISGHPMGLPFFAFVFLWPLKHTWLLEPAAIYLTLLFSFIGSVLFYKIILFYTKSEKKAVLFTFALAFATQYWHYSKTFWAEPYLASFLIIAWFFSAVKKKFFLSGVFLGAGFLIKYPFLLAILPFYIIILFENSFDKKLKSSIALSLPLICSAVFALTLNYYLTGNPLMFNQIGEVYFVNPLVGLLRWLFNPLFGLLTFSPVLMFALFGVNSFYKKNKAHCLATFSIVIISLLFWVSYGVTQTGAGGYSARYLVPLIPFLVLLCSFSNVEKSRYKHIFYISLAVSVLINILAAFAYPAFIAQPLLTAVYKVISFIQ